MPPPTSERKARRRARRRAQIRRRRITAVAALAAVAVIVALALGVGGGSSSSPPGPGQSTTAASPASADQLPATQISPQRLPAAVSGEAVAAQANKLFVIGGLDSGATSTGNVWSLDGSGGPVRSAGTLSAPLHDAAAVPLGANVLVMGGGSASTLDTVQELQPGGPARAIGHLPTAVSDLSAASNGGSVFAIGGYDGTKPVGSVLKSTDGRSFTKLADLPGTARYAATATVDGKVYLFGGELAGGGDSKLIQAIDLGTGRASVAGKLDRGLSHSSAVVLGGRIFVLGGRTAGAPTDRILAFDPGSGRTTPVGRLPVPVTNAAAGTIGDTGYLLGGLGAGGVALRSVVTVRLQAPPG